MVWSWWCWLRRSPLASLSALDGVLGSIGRAWFEAVADGARWWRRRELIRVDDEEEKKEEEARDTYTSELVTHNHNTEPEAAVEALLWKIAIVPFIGEAQPQWRSLLLCYPLLTARARAL